MRKNAGAAEKSRQDNIAPASIACTHRHKIVRDNAQQRAQLENIPAFLSQNRHRGTILGHGITLARDRLNQSGLATAIRPQNRHTLVAADAKAKIRENDFLSPHDCDVLQIQQCMLGHLHRVCRTESSFKIRTRDALKYHLKESRSTSMPCWRD